MQALIDATGGVKGDDKTPNWYAFEKLADRCTFIKESATTRYGELSKKIKGLLIGGERFITRVGVWRQEEMTAKRSEALLKNAEAFSWQVVNNCNPITNGQPRRVTEGLLVPVGSGNFKLRTESIE